MMHDNISVSVILPAYNEAKNLSVILPELNTVLLSTGLTYEVIVVDTKIPQDNTQEICHALHVRYINRKATDSFGDAIRTGIAEARGYYVIFMDADGSHDPHFILKMLEKRSQADIIIASRYIQGGRTENMWLLVLMSRVLNFIYSIVLGINCADISNNFKLYKRDMLITLNLRSQNFDIVEEILFKIVKTFPSVKIMEIPFYFERRRFGKTKRNLFSFIISFVVTLFKLRFMYK
jgi:dolichol-phosphate mannosyltransferase